MKERIFEIINNISPNSICVDDICRKLGLINRKEDVESIIRELLYDKAITCSNSKYEMYRVSPFREGVFIANKKGFGFVAIPLMDDVYIEAKNTNGAIDGDTVLIKILDKTRDGYKKEGKVKEIVERKNHMAEVITDRRHRFYKLDVNNRIMADIPYSIVDGMKVLVKIGCEKVRGNYPVKLLVVLGHKTEPGIDILQVMYEHDFDDKFPDEVLEEIKNLPVEVDPKDFDGRRDLRDKVIFTVDGDDTKDIDDAISIEKVDNKFVLGVHIADVTAYVKEGSVLDKEAFKRGTSVYLADRVSPMYPRELSNGICSLNPDVDRLALSCEMEFDMNGKVLNVDIYKSIIHSRKQMTYKNVNKIVEEGTVPEGYEEFVGIIKIWEELCNVLIKDREQRGMLEFASSEMKIIVDEDANVTGVEKYITGKGQKMIEVSMLAANECVSTYLENLGVNNIIRVHEKPMIEDIEEVINVLKQYGEKVDGAVSTDPRFMQGVMNNLKKSERYIVLSSYILRCMKKAKYDVVNLGHYGIGVDASKGESYSHFTSPIRRYPDTTLHRIVHKVLEGRIEEVMTKEDLQNLRLIAEHSSKKERDADECEREVNKMKSAEYMEGFIGSEYSGLISGFTSSGMFVMLDNLIEGRVSYSSMDDYYELNPELMMAIGKSNGKIYKLGDKVDIKVTRSSKEDKQIDFEIVKPKRNEQNGDIK